MSAPRPERSPLRRWTRRILIGLAVLIAITLLAGSIWEAVAWRRTLADYPPPGRMVDVGGHRLHLDCRGTGSPVVILEAGLDVGGTIGWSLVHDSLAATTRTCAYGRAGIVWSEPAPAPHDAATATRDLHALMAAAGEQPPFVLVGHSLGGPYIMAYTREHGDQVAGLVFVDASHPDQVERLNAVVGRPIDRPFGTLKAAAALQWTGVVRALAGGMGLPGVAEEQVAALRGYLPRSLGQMLLEAESLDTIFAQGGRLRDLGDRPVVVLTAQKPMDSTTRATLKIDEEAARRFQATWLELHRDEASWSTRSRHESVPDASHYIQLDRPDVVIRAVREVVDSVRARAAGPGTP